MVTGIVRLPADVQSEKLTLQCSDDDQPEELDTKDVYKEFRLRGYQYSGLFRSIKSATFDGTKGTIRWNSNWVAFMDNMLQMKLLGLDTRGLLVPTRIQKLVIDTKEHSRQIRSMPFDEQGKIRILIINDNQPHLIFKCDNFHYFFFNIF